MGSLVDLASMDDLSNRFNHFLKQDTERAQLIEVVLRKINEDKGRLDTLTIELEHERESRHRYQLELRDLREQRQRWEQLYVS
jgi:chromosome segregation ATPase